MNVFAIPEDHKMHVVDMRRFKRLDEKEPSTALAYGKQYRMACGKRGRVILATEARSYDELRAQVEYHNKRWLSKKQRSDPARQLRSCRECERMLGMTT